MPWPDIFVMAAKLWHSSASISFTSQTSTFYSETSLWNFYLFNCLFFLLSSVVYNSENLWQVVPFFEHFFIFWCNEILQNNHVFFLPSPWTAISLKVTVNFRGVALTKSGYVVHCPWKLIKFWFITSWQMFFFSSLNKFWLFIGFLSFKSRCLLQNLWCFNSLSLIVLCLFIMALLIGMSWLAAML